MKRNEKVPKKVKINPPIVISIPKQSITAPLPQKSVQIASQQNDSFKPPFVVPTRSFNPYEIPRTHIDKDPTARVGIIYFIQAGKRQVVKIGYTGRKNAFGRLGDLQVAHYEKLEIIATISERSVKDEGALHKRFKHLSIRGEWFTLNEEILDYIQLHAVKV